MQITREELVKHYAALNDDELLAVDCKHLAEWAYDCYCDELLKRDLSAPDPDPGEADDESHDDTPPEWLENASTACSMMIGTGNRYGEDVGHICNILAEAGVPSHITRLHLYGSPDHLAVMVPGALSLKAESILDRDWYNPEMEETWRTHFEGLSDEELHSLNADDLCAGMLDRAARLKRVFEESLSARDGRQREE